MSVEEFTYLRGRTTRPVKVTLVSAQQAAAYYDPDKSRGAYADARRLPGRPRRLHPARDRRSSRRLGCEYVQIDAPQYAALLDETIREGYRQRGSDPDRMLDACIELDNAIIDGHPGVTFGIHICRGNHQSMFYASGGYDRIAEQVFRRARFHRFLLEYDDERSGTFEPLRHVPDDRVVVLGLVSSKKPRLETESELRGAHRRGRAHRPARAPRAQPAVRVRVDVAKATGCPPTISGASSESWPAPPAPSGPHLCRRCLDPGVPQPPRIPPLAFTPEIDPHSYRRQRRA